MQRYDAAAAAAAAEEETEPEHVYTAIDEDLGNVKDAIPQGDEEAVELIKAEQLKMWKIRGSTRREPNTNCNTAQHSQGEKQ